MPPLRSCSVAAPHTRAATETARPVSLGAAEPSLGSVSGSCGHRRGQFGRVLSAQMATERPQRVPAGMGWTCRSRRRRKSACVQRSAGVSPPGFLGAHQALPELSSGIRRRCAAVARASQAEPSAVVLRPGMAWCPRARSLPLPHALCRLPGWPLLPAACAQRKAQLFGFRVGARLEKVVGVAVSAGMTRGKRTGDKQGGVKAPWHMGSARAVAACTSAIPLLRRRQRTACANRSGQLAAAVISVPRGVGRLPPLAPPNKPPQFWFHSARRMNKRTSAPCKTVKPKRPAPCVPWSD